MRSTKIRDPPEKYRAVVTAACSRMFLFWSRRAEMDSRLRITDAHSSAQVFVCFLFFVVAAKWRRSRLSLQKCFLRRTPARAAMLSADGSNCFCLFPVRIEPSSWCQINSQRRNDLLLANFRRPECSWTRSPLSDPTSSFPWRLLVKRWFVTCAVYA